MEALEELFEIKVATQGSDPACGIACVVMVTQRPCEEVEKVLLECRKTLLSGKPAAGKRTTSEELYSVLTKLEKRPACFDFTKTGLSLVQDCAIVAVERHSKKRGQNRFHWIVLACVDGTWFLLDPAADTEHGPTGGTKRTVVIHDPTQIVAETKAGEKAQYTPLADERSLRIPTGKLARIND